jgi:hypothetical protein
MTLKQLSLPQEQLQLLSQQIVQAARVELARRSLWEFALFLNEDFFTKREFLKEIADALQEIEEGKIKSLSISMPPRSGKSYIVSIFCAWYLGRNPTKCVMRNTVTSMLYNKFSYAIRDIIRSDSYRQVFPKSQLSKDKQNINCWALTESIQDAYFGGGVGSNIIGSGANMAITDDLYSGLEDAQSEVYNQKLELWKMGSHDSRKEKNCPEIDIGTRWSKNDLIGKNVEENKYDRVIVQPALVENDIGEWVSFCEDVKSTAEYLKIKEDILPEIFEAEYQQQPIEAKGILFQRAALNRFSMKELTDDGLETTLGYCDVKDEGNDYLSFPFAKIYKNKCFITDVIFTQDTVDVTLPQSAALFKRLKADYVRVEKNNQGGGFIRDLRKLVPAERVLSVHNTAAKLSRIWNEYAFILKYCYFLHDSEIIPGSDYDKFLKNLCAFMKDGSSKVDDAPDSVAGLARFVQANPQTQKLFTV